MYYTAWVMSVTEQLIYIRKYRMVNQLQVNQTTLTIRLQEHFKHYEKQQKKYHCDGEYLYMGRCKKTIITEKTLVFSTRVVRFAH